MACRDLSFLGQSLVIFEEAMKRERLQRLHSNLPIFWINCMSWNLSYLLSQKLNESIKNLGRDGIGLRTVF